MIDIGTGDGLFVYQSARQNPKKFYIGVDANPRPLEKLSEKIHRNPAKGGLPNVIFVQAAAEELPPELEAAASEVHIQFPWGSLLRAVATGDEKVLHGLWRVCSPGCSLEVLIGLDPERDRSEIARLGLKPLSAEYLVRELSPRYRAGGFCVESIGALGQSEWPKIASSWAKRLRGGAKRELVYIVARAMEAPA